MNAHPPRQDATPGNPPLRIATWNVNSLRARLDLTLRWLGEAKPDVVCLQETKVTDNLFPIEAIREAGWAHVAWYGQPTYNGVAMLSRHPLSDVRKGFDDGVDDPQARLIGATVQGIRVYGLYVPNGHAVGSEKFFYKLQWLERFLAILNAETSSDQPVLVCGDLNIAPDDVDVWDPFEMEGKLLCHTEERRRLQDWMDWGLHDAFRVHEPFACDYSWWDYRQMGFERNHGLRIDHILVTPSLLERCQGVEIHRHTRGWDKPSDHAPVVATFG